MNKFLEGILLRKIISVVSLVLLVFIVTACGDDSDDELHVLEVDFIVPESVDVNETMELKAVVTYGDDYVTDADEVVFEVWEKNDRDNGEMIDAHNHEDGTYTAEVTFEHDGIFEMYAHTTARDMHTMPKKEVIVGEGGEYDDADEENVFHTEGFELHFVELDDPTIDESYNLVTHIQMNEEPLENVDVSYEIWNDDMGDDREWVDAEETVAGEYEATFTFTDATTYHIQIHVQDEDELHEHAQYDININE